MLPFMKAGEGGGGGLFGIASPSVNMTSTTHSACIERKKSNG